jgi:glycosyltransferase involved in cell wall biosynthesis
VRILITNLYLRGRTGSEIATAELALGLARRGHVVAVFAPLIGRTAEDLRRQGVIAVDSLSEVPWTPEIIHGHHNIVAAAALIRFSQTPALFVSHSPIYWIEGPLPLSRISRVFAVSEACRERLIAAGGPGSKDIALLLNAVDLDRFELRPPLPKVPRRALVLTKNAKHLPDVRAAAAAANLSLDELGPGVGNVVDDLHTRLCNYDIVFATGRMALEALACGCAVIIADSRGLAGLVRSDVVDQWRQHNLGQRLLDRAVSVAGLLSEIKRYDAADARAVSLRIRDAASLSAYLESVEAIYRSILSGHAVQDRDTDLSELAAFYERVLKRLGEGANVDYLDSVHAQLEELEAGRKILRSPSRLFKRFFKVTLAAPLSLMRSSRR